MTFSNYHRESVQSASHSVVREAIPKLKHNWSQESWLACSNPYRQDPERQPNQEDQDSDLTPLAEYVAASVVTHCFDGWSYLGQALEAEMAGNPNTALHLGYYAELRAAMSVLASVGIGVFRWRHVVFTDEMQCVTLNHNNSHVFTWEALQAWADSTSGRDTLFKVIRPGGISLGEWLSYFTGSSNFIASDWLKQWGLDISRLDDDRSTRNRISYRPTALTTPEPIPVAETMKSILGFWEVFEPGAFGGFPLVDRYLLRRSLALLSEISTDDSEVTKDIYEIRKETMLGSLNPSEFTADQWKSFLEFDNLQDSPQIIIDASANDDAFHPQHSKQVLARATLLLRVATGATADLLDEAGPSLREDLAFWWSSTSVRRRLWLENDDPSSFVYLWNDISEALSSFDDYMPNDYYSLWLRNAREAATLATTERAFLWGVGL
ncbi:MAG: hypothetical protein OXO51_15760 [Gemmatimonadota bacterium]|nr:hypothetical protein [Gemmatimonadota bacterium]